MNITTARVEPHERATHEDFEYGFQSLIRNTAVLDRFLASRDVDYVAGGTVRAQKGTMNITVDAIWANGKQLDFPAFLPAVSAPIPITAPVQYPRFSIVQVRGVLQSFDRQSRAFFNPELESVQFFNIDTKNRLIADISIKHGEEGVISAPETDTGYIKIAEIYIEPETIELTYENIRNVSAAYHGNENENWTNENSRTFSAGTMSDLWQTFGREHLSDGQHREAVIKAKNILRGTAIDALKGSNVAIGENINSGDLSLPSTKTILESLSVIGEILRGDKADTLLKRLHMLIVWRRDETYQPFDPAFYQGRIFYANPLNLPGKGESPTDFPEKWINASGDVAYMPPDDDRLYGMRNRTWTELIFGGDVVRALKFYSERTLMLTNAGTVARRMRWWDIGLPYLSEDHEVYHFDTDNNNQNQQSNISLRYETEPVRLGADDELEGLDFTPVLSDIVPFERGGKSLFGAFSVSGNIAAQNSTLELWMRIFASENAVLLRVGTAIQDLVSLNIGGADPEYYMTMPGDIPLSYPDIVDGIPFSKSITMGNTLVHNWAEGSEMIDLDAEGVVLPQSTWLHIAISYTPVGIHIYIGDKLLSFTRRRPAAGMLPFVINEGMYKFNLDELSIINGAVINKDAFIENSVNRIPYAGLDYRQNYAVLMVDDPALFRTNIFESDQFKAAVREVINSNKGEPCPYTMAQILRRVL
jgi:hypothetical protein